MQPGGPLHLLRGYVFNEDFSQLLGFGLQDEPLPLACEN